MAMPPRKRKRNGNGKRVLKRTRRLPIVKLLRTRTRRTLGPRPNKAGIMPDRKVATLRYFVGQVVDVDTTFKTLQFRANGLFDPEIAVGGHQPRGFDQWMVLYEKFAVMSCTINVKIYNRSSKEPCAASVILTEAGIANDTSLVDMIESNPKTSKVGYWHSESGRFGMIRHTVNIAKYVNASSGIRDDLDLHGTISADPVKAVTWQVNLTNGGGINCGNTDVNVTLIYRVMFLEPNKFGAS